jgi:hypothetical protein
VVGSVRSRLPDRSAMNCSRSRTTSDPTLDRTSVLSHHITRVWRRLNVPTELFVIAFAAAVTRFTAITHPHAIVSDEVYFREFALRYLDGTYSLIFIPRWESSCWPDGRSYLDSPPRYRPPIHWWH